MKRIRFLCLTLSLMLLLPLCACGEGAGVGETSTDPGTSAASETEEDKTAVMEKTLAALPEYDFDGHTFTFLCRTHPSASWAQWINRDIYSEGFNSEVINDAVYTRNLYIQDRYDCVVAEYKTTDYRGSLMRSIQAGDHEYDVVLPPISEFISLAADGYLYDMNQIDTMQLDEEWWDQNANQSLSIAHKLYATSGDLLLVPNDALGAFVFNKQLINDWHIENPYELVRNGKWTFDTFESQIADLGTDLNSDGKMNGQDAFGFMIYADVEHCFYHGAGLDYAVKNEDDVPVLAYNEEQSIEVFERIFALLNNRSVTYSLHMSDEFAEPETFVFAANVFMSDHILYYWLRLRDIEGLRSMPTDFGILPIPKWDEHQQNYRATVNFYTSCCLSIPVSCIDPEGTGLFLNALCCRSMFDLQPAYYDITLTGKYPRDVESSDMLDLMFANRVFDIGMFGNFNGLTDQLKTMLINDDRNFASQFKKTERTAGKQLDSIVKKIEKLDH